MKKLYTIVALSLVLVGLLSLCSCGKNASKNPADIAALAEIKNEPKVIEAILTDNVLYVSVVDDGTRRDGYASYLCQILKDHKAITKRVKVMKAGSTNDPNKDNAYGVLLGESQCGN